MTFDAIATSLETVVATDSPTTQIAGYDCATQTFPDGEAIGVSGEPTIDHLGRLTGHRGVARDITQRKHEERILRLEHSVMRCLAETGDVANMLEQVIRVICETLHCTCGVYLHADRKTNVLRAMRFWGVRGSAGQEIFTHWSDRAVAPGAGIAGRVWQSGAPIWLSDISVDALLGPPDIMRAKGIRAAFSFPTIANGNSIGVFVLFSNELQEPDRRLLDAVALIGAHVAQFLERKAAEDRLRFQALLLNTAADAVIATDGHGTITYWNAYAEQLYGWTAAEVLGKNVLELIRAEERETRDSTALRKLAKGQVWQGERQVRRRNGTLFPTQLTLAPIADDQGRLTGVIGVSRDISDLKSAEKAIRDYARQQAVLAALGQAAFAIAGLDDLLARAVLAIGDGLGIGYCRILQFTPDQQALVVKAGLDLHELKLDRHVVDAGAGTQQRFALDTAEPLIVRDFATETRFRPDKFVTLHGMRSGVDIVIGGAAGLFGVLGAYSRDIGGFSSSSVDFLQNVANMLATVIDRRAAEEKIAYLAQFDSLTGLPSRNLLRDRLARTMAQAARQRWRVGVMLVGLDGFKDVNDTFGHGVGDELLVQAGRRLGECIREGDTVGRLGGDEFAIVLSNVAKADDANVVALRVLEALARPFEIDGHDIRVTGSLGISIYPGDGGTPDIMLKNADAAMYTAKEQGRNCWHFYTEALDTRISGRLALEQELRQAIERKEFRLHYQPEVDLASGRIIGVEALIRWQHPERGLLAPAEFIAVAEETGLILPIGKWVMETACVQAAEWHRRGHRELFVAVNVSPMEIRRGNVVEQTRAALAVSGLNPRCLEVELTEGLGMDGAESFIRTLDALKALGVAIAIDDFGTGYSTLGYLKRFPIDKVKIDRMFIADIVTEIDDAAIVQAIIAMAHHLKLKVTAEGVETTEQAAFLHQCRCDIVQGYLFGRPVDAVELGRLLSQRQMPARWLGPRTGNRALRLVHDEGRLRSAD